MPWLVVAFVGLQLTSGAWLIRWFDPAQKISSGARAVMGGVVGLVVSGYGVLLIALLTRSLLSAISIVGLLLAAFLVTVAIRAWPGRKQERKISTHLRRALVSPWNWLMAAVLGVVVTLTIQVLLPEPPYVAGVLVGWGDVALHLGMIERLSVANPFILEHPALAGHPLSYSFLINFFSAIYRKLGASVLVAFHLPALIFGVSAVVLLWIFFRQLVRHRGLVLLMLTLVLFGGGLGWWWLGADIGTAYQAGGIAAVRETLGNLPHEYTHLDLRTGGVAEEKQADHNIVWIVPVLSFLTHQRSFPMGLSLGLIVLLGVVYYGECYTFARYGVLAGLLPLAHGHTLLAFAVLFAGLLVSRPRNFLRYAAFGAVTVAVAMPSLLYLRGAMSGSAGGSFTAWWWGWMTCTHGNHWFLCDVPAARGTDASAVWFWIKNFGGIFVAWAAITLGAWVAAVVRRPRVVRPAAISWLVPAALLFAVPNLVRLQPWEFDNNKVLLWWWILAIGIIGQAVSELSRRWRVAGAGLLALVVLPAGAADVAMRLVHFRANHFGYVGAAEIDAASWIRANLEPNAGIVGSSSANAFVPLLAGRPLALGFVGWLWTEGVDYAPRQRAIAALAAGDSAPACAEGLGYVIDDADFRASVAVNAAAFPAAVRELWRQETPAGPRVVYQIVCPAGGGAE